MSCFSNIQILGRAGRDGEIKEKDGAFYVRVPVVVDHLPKKEGGKPFQEWFSVMAPERFRNQVLDTKMGDIVYVSGRPSASSYTSKDGAQRTSISIFATDYHKCEQKKEFEPQHQPSVVGSDSEDIPF